MCFISAKDGGKNGAGWDVWGPPPEKIAILGSKNCIWVDPGDCFAMHNGESKNLIEGPDPGSATAKLLKNH